jgi:heptosyltransferase III
MGQGSHFRPQNGRAAMTRIELPERPRILVVALRRLGDVLLTTPLIRSLRRAWPDARIDALVFADTAPILEGNVDLDNVVSMPTRPTAWESVVLAGRLARRYALAVSTQSGDRPTLFACIAGRHSIAPIEPGAKGALRRLLVRQGILLGEGRHRVEDVLSLADVLGIARAPRVVAPAPTLPEGLPKRAYAIVHAAPMFHYKRWTRDGWRALAAALAERGLPILATGGPSQSERAYLDDVWQDILPAEQRLDSRLSWSEITGCLTHAKVYIGPDTAVTHLAAASGCPTVAIYGPTDPRRWGPWPVGGLREPWAAAGTIQRRGNVWLVQNPLPCMPCQLEGCDRHLASRSQCLDELTPNQVLLAVDDALAGQSDPKAGAAAQSPVRMA